jgi:3-hydroxyacyl-CoA dehydrogenase
MTTIKSAAVIGAGTMGAGIASHLANAGIPVVLLDIAGGGAGNRNALSEGAVQRLLCASPPAFMHRDRAALIRPGNVDDHLSWLADADWIAEAVVERLDVKHRLYEAVDEVRKPGSIVSSNTSTIPLSLLSERMPDSFKGDFCITHFFNPVRYMRLLELVAGPRTRPEVIDELGGFCDHVLGKGVVVCNDTPGFLGNRVGVFALQVAIVEAVAAGLTVEEVDAIVGRPMGIPKTGVFGLYDLIGLDLMLDVAGSLASALPDGDAFNDVAGGIPLIAELVARGRTGNKGGAGFYRDAGDGGDARQAIDLASGEYRAATRPVLEAAAAGERDGLRALVEYPDRYGRYAWRVLARTLSYAASLVPQVCTGILPVDEAMKLGYNWARGPFEMIDAMGVAWFRDRLRDEGLPVAPILEAAGAGPLYRVRRGGIQYLDGDGGHRTLRRAPGVMRLGDITRTGSPLLDNDCASLWDIGDGVACVEFHSKANALKPESMALLRESLSLVERDFRALLIHNDAPHFSVGFNLEFVLECARQQAWQRLDESLQGFQKACLGLRYAPFPVVAAPAGMSVGGGFEILLHADALQSHANTVMGLVETLVGLVPSGGGCKELLHRWTHAARGPEQRLQGALKVFELIGMGKTASSPAEAASYRFFLETDRSTMNRDRLLGEAKARALSLVDGYAPPAHPAFEALGSAGFDAMQAMLDGLDARGITAAHDLVVGARLARLLCGGGAKAGEPLGEDDICALEREAFVSLVGTSATVARIEHMLDHGRPLRN